MIYVKCAAAGVAGALIVATLIGLGSDALRELFYRLHGEPPGSAAVGAVGIGLTELAAPLVVGFAGGFYWQWRRASRRAPHQLR